LASFHSVSSALFSAVESFVGALEDVLKSLTDKGDGETNAYRHLQIKVGAKGLLAGDLT
jgi:hypothetical protein